MAKRLLAVIAFWLLSILPAHALLPEPKAPTWGELTPTERQALAPISSEYDKLPDAARLRFQSAARRYSKLSPPEQERFQSRLTDWAKLKPEDRKKAREKYKIFKELPPEKRKEVKEKWHEREEKKQGQPPTPSVNTPVNPPAQQTQPQQKP
ncbi:MAG: DUF3106 domain-containing protein [Pseudomonadota bacterium]